MSPKKLLKLLEEQYQRKKYKDEDFWETISRYKNLNHRFIIEYIDKLPLENVIHYQSIDFSTIEKIKDKLTPALWDGLCQRQLLTERFMRDNEEFIAWHHIAKSQKYLSEKFIKDFQDKLNWNDVALYQKLSLEFIKRNLNKLEQRALIRSKLYSEKQMELINKIYECYGDLVY
jgi:hypothetical protein